MAAVAHNPAFAKKAGVPQSVGKDFNEADKGRKFSKGGDMKMVNKGGKMVPHFAADGKGKMAHGGDSFVRSIFRYLTNRKLDGWLKSVGAGRNSLRLPMLK